MNVREFDITEIKQVCNGTLMYSFEFFKKYLKVTLGMEIPNEDKFEHFQADFYKAYGKLVNMKQTPETRLSDFLEDLIVGKEHSLQYESHVLVQSRTAILKTCANPKVIIILCPGRAADDEKKDQPNVTIQELLESLESHILHQKRIFAISLTLEGAEILCLDNPSEKIKPERVKIFYLSWFSTTLDYFKKNLDNEKGLIKETYNISQLFIFIDFLRFIIA